MLRSGASVGDEVSSLSASARIVAVKERPLHSLNKNYRYTYFSWFRLFFLPKYDKNSDNQCFGSVFIWYGSDPARFWWPKIEKFYSWKKFKFFVTTIYLSLGLHKGCLSYRRSLQPSKENTSTFQNMKFLIFSTSVGHFCPPGSGFQIRNWIHWPDWIRIQYGSGSETLQTTLFWSCSIQKFWVSKRTQGSPSSIYKKLVAKNPNKPLHASLLIRNRGYLLHIRRTNIQAIRKLLSPDVASNSN